MGPAGGPVPPRHHPQPEGPFQPQRGLSPSSRSRRSVLRGDRAQSKSQTMGKDMAERSWFYAASGQQQGPVSEAQLRDLIGRGTVTADTLVWSEGMAAWQRAGEIPGLSSGGAAPPVIPRSGRMISSAGGYGGGGTLSVDFGIWDFVWRT